MPTSKEQADQLVQSLGPGWIGHGWGTAPLEFEAEKNGVTVYPVLRNEKLFYRATIGIPSPAGQRLQLSGDDADPRVAVTKVLSKFDNYITELQGVRQKFSL